MILSGTPERSRPTARAWRKAWEPLRSSGGKFRRLTNDLHYAVESGTVFERTMRCLDVQKHLLMRAGRRAFCRYQCTACKRSSEHATVFQWRTRRASFLQSISSSRILTIPVARKQ